MTTRTTKRSYETFCSMKLKKKLKPTYGEEVSNIISKMLRESLQNSNKLELREMMSRGTINKEMFQYNKEILNTRNSIIKDNTQEYNKSMQNLDSILKDIRVSQSTSKDMIDQLKSQLRLDLSKDRDGQREMVNRYTHILHEVRNQVDSDYSEALKTANTIKEATALRWSGVTYTAIACIVMYFRLVGT